MLKCPIILIGEQLKATGRLNHYHCLVEEVLAKLHGYCVNTKYLLLANLKKVHIWSKVG